MQKQIVSFQIVDHGIEHEQYFQGCGVAFTEFDDVATGCGTNPAEAIDDALEQLAEQGYDVDGMEERILEDCGLADFPDTPSVPDGDEDCWYYISIRVKAEPTTVTADRDPNFAEFWKGYCHALCFTAHEDIEGGDSLFHCHGKSADRWDGEAEVYRLLDSDSIAELKNDCAGFFLDNQHLFNGEFETAGADFHFTRNGHGCGFWDRNCYGGHEQELTAACRPYGSCELLGDLSGETAFLCH